MKEEEDSVAYMLWVDVVVNTIRGLDEKIEESMILQKVLRSLTWRIDDKVSSLKERKDIDSLIMDELHGIVTAYEMRIGNERPWKWESTSNVWK